MPQTAQTDQLTHYDAAFAAAMRALRLDTAPVLISALSGGPDSSALACLAERYAVASGKQHFAVIVNHAIRPGSTGEAARVQQRMAARSLAATVVTLDVAAPQTGIQEWARQQRFAVLTKIARQNQAVVLVAHHQADQAETVLMRLTKGSGPAGLGGMRALNWRDGVVVARPLLGWTADDLQAVLRHCNCDYETDPSNHNTDFERVRVRQALADPARFGCPAPDQLIRFGQAMTALTAHLEAASAGRWWQAVDMRPTGDAVIDMSRLYDLPPLAWQHWARHLIRMIGGRPYGVAGAALERLFSRLIAGQNATLGGCQFVKSARPDDAGCFQVVREVGRRPLECPVTAGDDVIFAGCWHVKTAVSGQLVNGHAAHKMPQDWATGKLPAVMRDLPYLVRRAIPVLNALDGTSIYPQVRGVQSSETAKDAPLVARFLGRQDWVYDNPTKTTGQ